MKRFAKAGLGDGGERGCRGGFTGVTGGLGASWRGHEGSAVFQAASW